ncbi:hypothetical protein LTR53_001496 [Teratosphaeriaceae sp. CCFEE 6253]|nr:hypothetical protein LTR53_001496 [Teratosphaeriaceae sp. CCFEE 6253]
MLKEILFCLVGVAAPAVTAAVLGPGSVLSSHPIHEKRDADSALNRYSDWQRSGRVDADAIVPVRIGLKQSNLNLGEERLLSISHPASKDYGRHLSAEEVHELFAPSHDVVSTVRDWLIKSGIDSKAIAHSDNKGWLAVDVSAKDAERLFQSELYEFEHANTGALRIGCDEYRLPAHLREHIDYVTPGVKLSAPLKKSTSKRSTSVSSGRRGPGPGHHGGWMPIPSHTTWHMPPPAYTLPADLQACGVNITPPCLRALYGIPPGQISDSVNSLGLFEQGDYYAAEDVDNYYATFAPWVPQGTRPILKSVDGGYAPYPVNDTDHVTGESNIDIDIVTSLIYPQSVTLYQVDDAYYAPREVALDNTFNTFLDALDGSYCNYSAYGITGDSDKDPVYPDNATEGYKGQRQCGIYKPTRVISASYGESEGCNEFLKLGLQGHTIFFSSGDFGVGNFPGDPGPIGCFDGPGQNQMVFNPAYPGGCPWLTSVGATMLYANQTVQDAESAMAVDLWREGRNEAYHTFSSSGGFSNVFESPSYQSRAVSTWFAQHDPGYPTYVANANLTNIGSDGGRYNRAGRAYPDVSANGAYMPIYINGAVAKFFGSSLSAPIWAAVITMINQQRTIAGKGPVGFINPVLYEHPWALNDIKNGSNAGCKSDGFAAVSGWDPVTGLGTPNYPKLERLFLSLP